MCPGRLMPLSFLKKGCGFMNAIKTLMMVLSVSLLSVSVNVVAGAPLGAPLGTRLGNALSAPLPFGDGGFIGLAAAGVIGLIWLARRHKK